jgi:hypothetical protein
LHLPLDEAYVTDAYHSLSIEGYRVTTDLIQRVRSGSWNPDAHEQDREQRNAMAPAATGRHIRKWKKSLGKVPWQTTITALGNAKCSRRASPPAS